MKKGNPGPTNLKLDLPVRPKPVDQPPELVCRRAPDGSLTFVNDAYCAFFGFPREELLGHRFNPLIPEEERRMLEQVNATLTPENPQISYEHRTLSVYPEPRWLQWTRRGIFDEQGKPIEYQYVGRDITEQKMVEEEMRFYGSHDLLTRLYNLSFFHTEMDRLERGRTFPISILLCLAEVNEGGDGGRITAARERLYQQTAQMLRCAFRAEDIIARLQDGLFGVLLPSTERAVAMRGLERVRKCLETQKRLEGGSGSSYRLGLATGDKGASLTDLLRQAEQHLLDQPEI